MRVAISNWNNCISPVFDVAKNLLLIDISEQQITASQNTVLQSALPFTRAQELADKGIDVLICGAISQTMQMAVSGQSIALISFVFGPLDTIISAYLNGQLQDGGNEAWTRQPNESGRHRRHRRQGRNSQGRHK